MSSSYFLSRKYQCRSIDDYEIIHQCGSGTYGYVFKAVHRKTRNIVALKKVNKFPTEEGSPVEIKYLSQLGTSRNVIRLKDHFFTKEGELALVFEYMETDLWRLISGPSPCLPLYQVKCIMKQLLEALYQCHTAGIMHRDVKPSNLLISSSGVLKLADFGLTTSYISPTYLSNNVVSLYYRSPELLMGSHAYGPEIDVWSAGCILVELLTNNYLFAGSSDSDQLDLIFRTFGTPTERVWPGVTLLPGWNLIEASEQNYPFRTLKDNYGHFEPNVLDLATRLLTLNPKDRISCYEALQHPWFWTTPLPCHPIYLPQLWKRPTDPPNKHWRKASSSVDSNRSERDSVGSNSDSTSTINNGGSNSKNNNVNINMNNSINNDSKNESGLKVSIGSSTGKSEDDNKGGLRGSATITSSSANRGMGVRAWSRDKFTAPKT